VYSLQILPRIFWFCLIAEPEKPTGTRHHMWSPASSLQKNRIWTMYRHSRTL